MTKLEFNEPSTVKIDSPDPVIAIRNSTYGGPGIICDVGGVGIHCTCTTDLIAIMGKSSSTGIEGESTGGFTSPFFSILGCSLL